MRYIAIQGRAIACAVTIPIYHHTQRFRPVALFSSLESEITSTVLRAKEASKDLALSRGLTDHQ